MRNIVNLGLILLTSLFSSAFAANPSVNCGGSGWCFFQDLQLYNNGNGPAAYFYCVANSSSINDIVYGSNHAALITGFDTNGNLETNINTFNHYYFAAYKDPNKSDTPYASFATNKGTVSCYPGKGTGRIPYSGMPHI